MRANRSIPPATVIPVLAYPDLPAAIDWITAAFGFTVRLRIANHRAQMNVGDGAVVLTDGGTTLAPNAARTHSVMIRVTGIDAHCERAIRHGARILQPPETYPYGERQYAAADLAGHIWKFTETLADVDPADWGGTLA
jgi:uncharacterized glyoxalase superfamily protein PhnB